MKNTVFIKIERKSIVYFQIIIVIKDIKANYLTLLNDKGTIIRERESERKRESY